MRAAGLQMGFLQILSAGPAPNPTYVNDNIGTSFMTPEQGFFKAQRKRFGADDPDAGGYSLAQIDWNKDNGDATYAPLEPTTNGWINADGM
jgi:hypothetical protein